MTLIEVIYQIAPNIEMHPAIHAMWLEGSYATGKFNDKSDIDVWLDVEDGSFDECVDYFRQLLQKVVDIESEKSRGVYSEDPKLMKQTFILRDFPPGQEVELDLQEHGRKYVFSRDADVIKVIFDKDNTIQWG